MRAFGGDVLIVSSRRGGVGRDREEGTYLSAGDSFGRVVQPDLILVLKYGRVYATAQVGSARSNCLGRIGGDDFNRQRFLFLVGDRLRRQSF